MAYSSPTKDELKCLREVAKEGDLETLEYFIEKKKYDVGTRPEKKYPYDNATLLLICCKYGHLAAAQRLLELGADINATEEYGNTALHLAVLRGHENVIRFLLGYDHDLITKANNDGWTALHLAAYGGHEDVIRFLLEQDRDLIKKTTNNGSTAVHLAARGGHASAMKILLDHSPDLIEQKDNDGDTPLDDAVRLGRSNVVYTLVHQYNVNITQCKQHRQEEAKQLLAAEEAKHNEEANTSNQATSQSDSIDTNVIMAYEAAMKEGSESSNQFKLVTLGAEGAGKTSSINTLLNLPFQPNQESTVGASVNSCTVDMHLTTSKWKKMTATFQITEIPKLYKKEINAAVKLSKSDPVKPNLVKPDTVNPDVVNLDPVNPVPQKPISQKVIDEVKEIIASKEEIPQDGHIRIAVFDIGGQEVYYDVHFLFLAIEDVALLVFDCSKGLDDPVISRHRTGRFGEKIATRGMLSNIKTIELLLHSVYSRGQKAPDGSISYRAPVVIMVGAHAEGLSYAEKEMIIQTICQRFDGKPFLEHLPQSKKEAFHFLANSNADPESVEHLRSTVLKAAEVVIATKRPISYLKFEGKILQKIEQGEVRLTRASAIDIARGAGVEGEQAVDSLLRYFTNKGILLYYPEVKPLKNDVFISPQEVSDLVCAVITTHECQPPTAELQRSYRRYNQYALLEEALLNFILLQFNRSRDKEVLLGLLDKFNLATEVPASTRFSREIRKSTTTTSKLFIVPPLLVYDEKVSYHKQDGDIVVQYYFKDEFLPESIFNQLLVKTMQWCFKHNHIIRDVYRGVGYFSFGDALWQHFQLQWCQSTSSINCYITIEQSHHPPSEMLPVLLQQRRQLLIYLESSVAEVSKCCMPSTKPPLTCLECPLHKEECTPHVVLDINKRDVLVCHNMLLPKRIPEESYILLYQELASAAYFQAPSYYNDKPKIWDLIKIVVPKIKAEWKYVAYSMKYDIEDVNGFEEDFSNLAKRCQALFENWLSTPKGITPKTWLTLLKCIREVDELKSVAEKIDAELKAKYGNKQLHN